ncbi:hypothetical protein B4U84_04000 [Westiellopsis prolifica IICB1]|nr:hypothetical protein B4U84_04000 [Westiellopsis prolifica IICB1]
MGHWALGIGHGALVILPTLPTLPSVVPINTQSSHQTHSKTEYYSQSRTLDGGKLFFVNFQR